MQRMAQTTADRIFSAPVVVSHTLTVFVRCLPITMVLVGNDYFFTCFDRFSISFYIERSNFEGLTIPESEFIQCLCYHKDDAYNFSENHRLHPRINRPFDFILWSKLLKTR